MTQQRFHCPALGCEATYTLLFRPEPPEEIPKCARCGREFPPKFRNLWLHYQAAGRSNGSE
jgi:hypothetical protein